MAISESKCPHCGKALTRGEIFRGVCKGCKGLVNEPPQNPIRIAEAADDFASPPSPPQPSPGDEPAQIPTQKPSAEQQPTYKPVSEDMLPPRKPRIPRNVTAIIGERFAAAAWFLFLLAFVGGVPWFLVILAGADDLAQLDASIKLKNGVTDAVFLAAAVLAAAALVILIIGLCVAGGSRAGAISALILSAILASFVITGWHKKAFDVCYGEYLEERLDDWKFEHRPERQGPDNFQGPKVELSERSRFD